MDRPFGEILRELREKKGLTVNQLGIYSEVSPGLISKLENGKRGTPKPDTIEKLAKGLRMEYSVLMNLAGYYMSDDGRRLPIGEVDSEERDEFIESFVADLKELPEDTQKQIHDLIKTMKKKS